ncbi:acylamino-acid-releasing enzyme-like [Ciona intestinalis]
MATMEDKCVSVYRELSLLPSVHSVEIVKNNDVFHIDCVWQHNDLERFAKIKYRKSGLFKKAGVGFEVFMSPICSEVTGEQIISLSECGLKRAVLREATVGGKSRQYLEIWENSIKVTTIDFVAEDKHGLVYSNAVFGCLEWSRDGRKVLYIAEEKVEKSCSYFKKVAKDETKGLDGLHREDWGEQLVGCCRSSLYIYDVESESILSLCDLFPPNISIGKSIWSDDGKTIIALGWDGAPWKVGLIYCKNRRSAVYQLNLDSHEVVRVTDGNSCVYSPIINPSGTKLFYLQSQPFGPHRQCGKLMSHDIVDGKIQNTSCVVVDVVENDNFSFNGLYMESIPHDCWWKDEIIFATNHRSNISMFALNVNNGVVRCLATDGAWRVHRVVDDIIIASCSTPNTPPSVKVGLLSDEVKWTNIESSSTMDDISWEVIQHTPNYSNDEYSGLTFESILIKPTHTPIKGLIVNPHGGPHGCYPTSFDLQSAALCKLGFAVSRVNYRGSTGFGQNSIFSLPGNISKQDVCDVQQVAEFASDRLNMGVRFITGGSHGGFLTLQLIGQYPDYYSAASARNPVTNIASIVSTSDIRDWAFCVAGYEFSYDACVTPEMYNTMLNVSPIIHVDDVTTPVMIMLGEADLRVPISQSHEYARMLRARGKTIRLFQYKDNDHPIANVKDEADCFVNILLWFNKYCKSE